MMKLKLTKASLLIAGLLVVSLAPEISFGQVAMKGTVVDESGNAIEKANVWIQTAAPKSGKGYL